MPFKFERFYGISAIQAITMKQSELEKIVSSMSSTGSLILLKSLYTELIIMRQMLCSEKVITVNPIADSSEMHNFIKGLDKFLADKQTTKTIVQPCEGDNCTDFAYKEATADQTDIFPSSFGGLFSEPDVDTFKDLFSQPANTDTDFSGMFADVEPKADDSCGVPFNLIESGASLEGYTPTRIRGYLKLVSFLARESRDGTATKSYELNDQEYATIKTQFKELPKTVSDIVETSDGKQINLREKSPETYHVICMLKESLKDCGSGHTVLDDAIVVLEKQLKYSQGSAKQYFGRSFGSLLKMSSDGQFFYMFSNILNTVDNCIPDDRKKFIINNLAYCKELLKSKNSGRTKPLCDVLRISDTATPSDLIIALRGSEYSSTENINMYDDVAKSLYELLYNNGLLAGALNMGKSLQILLIIYNNLVQFDKMFIAKFKLEEFIPSDLSEDERREYIQTLRYNIEKNLVQYFMISGAFPMYFDSFLDSVKICDNFESIRSNRIDASRNPALFHWVSLFERHLKSLFIHIK